MIEGAALAVIRQLRDEHDVIERIAGVHHIIAPHLQHTKGSNVVSIGK